MKYSNDLTQEICKYLHAGNNQRDSAALAGISEETFYVWIRTKPEFSESVKKAELECKSRNIAIIQKAAITTWQSAAWWLERKYFDEFGIKQRFEHTGEGGRPIQYQVITYGKQDPLITYLSSQLRSVQFKSPSANGNAGSTSVSSPQLAPQGSKDDSSNSPVDKVGE